jgi:uncharacterized membrane protein
VVFVDFLTQGALDIFGRRFSWIQLLSFLGFISTSACFSARYLRLGSALEQSNLEKNLRHLFSALATIYLTIFIWQMVDLRWLTLSLTLEILFLFILSSILSDKPLRLYAGLLILVTSFRFCLIDNYYGVAPALKWLVLSAEVLAFYYIYFLYTKLKKENRTGGFESPLIKAVFVLSTFLFTYVMFRYIPRSWVSLALGIEGVVLFLSGFLAQDKVFRLGGFIIFALTISRIVFVDLAMLHIIYKIISFILLGILFLGISYIYTKYNISKTKQ